MRYRRRMTLVACTGALMLLGFVSSPAWGMEPPTREQVQQYLVDGSLGWRVAAARARGNDRVSPDLVRSLKTRMKPVLGPAAGPAPDVAAPANDTAAVDGVTPVSPFHVSMPAKGNVKMLVLLLSFTDAAPRASDTPSSIAAKLFGDGPYAVPYDSLRNFYRRSSYNQLEIGGTVLGWYQAPYTRAQAESLGSTALIKEALSYYDAQNHDFTQYDNNGDGVIDSLTVIWTGAHGDWASFWWGWYTSGFGDSTYRLDGKRLGGYSWQWEVYNWADSSYSFEPNVVIHETGHAIGLPDYYDYDGTVGPNGGVGGLDRMDSNGDHNCFSKYLLEWITPTIIGSGSGSHSLRPSGTSSDALLVMPGATATQFGEFYMVQNRQPVGNDVEWSSWAPNGLLIWHVDARLNSTGNDFLYDNSYTSHKLLRLMESDGLEQIEQNRRGNAGDFYTPGGAFSPTTAPSSNDYAGQSTGIEVKSITLGTGVLDLVAGMPSAVVPTTIAVNSAPLTGQISPAGDEDLYEFTVASAGTYLIDTDAGTLTDSSISVYGPNSQSILIRSVDNVPGDAMAKTTETLQPGTYYVKVKAAGAATTGTYTIQVTALLPTRIEQTDSRLSYTGTWTTVSNGYASGTSYRRTAAGDLTVTFTGTSIDWIAVKTSNFGKAQVTLDGVTQPLIDLYSATTAYKEKVYSSGTLLDGPHTLKIAWTGQRTGSGTSIDVDAFDVVGTVTQAVRFPR